MQEVLPNRPLGPSVLEIECTGLAQWLRDEVGVCDRNTKARRHASSLQIKTGVESDNHTSALWSRTSRWPMALEQPFP